MQARENHHRFDHWDYVVLALSLATSCSAGIYHIVRNKNRTVEEFLFAGRAMGCLPLAMSQMATYASALTMISVPTEVYLCGIQFCIAMGGYLFSVIAGSYIYLPRYFALRVNSVTEYLEHRFCHRIRMFSAIIYTIPTVLYLSTTIYVPSLAINQVFGIGIWESIAPMAIVCILYTSLGGFRTVVWTDVFQGIIIIVTTLLIVILGIVHVGGISNVWGSVAAGQRDTFFNWRSTPTSRYTVWSLNVGYFYIGLYTTFGNQLIVQRHMAAKNIKESRKSLLIGNLMYFIVFMLACFLGLVTFANYYNCDPVRSKMISSVDQVIPLFAMEIIDYIPGLPGLYVGGILAATISTFSSGINALSLIIMEDFIKVLKPNISEQKCRKLYIIIGICIGVVCIVGVLFSQLFSSAIQASLAGAGTASGAIMGLITLGILVPWASSLGAFLGCVCSISFTGYIILQARSYGYMQPSLPVATSECDRFGLNNTFHSLPSLDISMSQIPPLFTISPMWYSVIGFAVVFVVGSIVNLIIGPQNFEELPDGAVSPTVKKLCLKLPRKFRSFLGFKSSVTHLEHEESIPMRVINE